MCCWLQVERNVVFYGCCKEPFPDVTFHINIRRRSTYYLYNVIFPCVMMSALTLLVFCLPPDSGEKITMGITVLLAFSVFLLRMGEDLPETSEFIPLLSEYTSLHRQTTVAVHAKSKQLQLLNAFKWQTSHMRHIHDNNIKLCRF